MKDKSFVGIFCVLIAALVINSCAQQGMPSGGDRDTTPPKILETEPANYSTNFTAEKIRISFSEFIRLQNLKDELIITPYSKTQPKVTLRGKDLIISLKDIDLIPNTTYTFNFGNAIADITEGNINKDFRYVFSTGNEIDSFSVRGIVEDAFTKKPDKELFVMLYKKNIDSLPNTSTPDYLSKTNDSGEFIISNIPSGNYKIFALKDKNNNLKFDLPGERIAFLNQPIESSTVDSNQIVLNSFVEDHEKQYVKSFKALNHGQIRLILNLPAKEVNIKALHYDDNNWYIKDANKDKDSINYWIKSGLKTNKLKCQISADNQVLDTMEVSIPDTTKEFRLKFESNLNGLILPPQKPLALISNRPIAKYDSSKIVLTEDSIPIQFEIKSINDLNKYQLLAKLKDEKKYELIIYPKAFTDIQGNYNIDTLNFKFQKTDLSSYSSLEVDLKVEHKGHYLLELLKGNKILKTKKIAHSEKVKYVYLLPGNYGLRLIQDGNNNEKWDLGNYKADKQAEAVLMYQGEINIKSNWNQSVEWKTGF